MAEPFYNSALLEVKILEQLKYLGYKEFHAWDFFVKINDFLIEHITEHCKPISEAPQINIRHIFLKALKALEEKNQIKLSKDLIISF